MSAAAMIEFLRWIDAFDRTYSDVMEAWQTSCPRLSIWEDAQIDGLVYLDESSGVKLTEAGVSLVSA